MTFILDRPAQSAGWSSGTAPARRRLRRGVSPGGRVFVRRLLMVGTGSRPAVRRESLLMKASWFEGVTAKKNKKTNTEKKIENLKTENENELN
jgi:hypothetical protein